MTNNINSHSDSLTLATTIADTLYNFPTLADATDYFQSELMIAADDTILDRTSLMIALDNDIADLLHNSNLSDLIPNADDLADADYDALSDRIRDDDSLLPMIADRILNRLDATADNFND